MFYTNKGSYSTAENNFDQETFTDPVQIRSPLKPRQNLRPLSLNAFQLSAINSQRLQNQRRNLRREDSLCELLRLSDSRTANETSYVPVIGAQTAVLFDLRFGGRVDDSELGFDDDVGHEWAVNGSTES